MSAKTTTKPFPKSARTVAWIKPNKKLSRGHTIVRGKGSEITLTCGSTLPSFDGAELLFDQKEAEPCRMCAKRSENGKGGAK
jgi:hypothetical protein